MSFDDLKGTVNDGMFGKNEGVPMGFDRLNRYIGLRKSMYHLVGGLTGSGKTSFIDDAYVLNPIDWILSPEGKASGIKLHINYRSMERSRSFKLAKWVIRKIFIDHGIIIPMGTMLGWKGFDKLTKDEHDLFLCCEEYICDILDMITLIDGPENPIGIAKQIKQYALERGTIEKLDDYNKIYIPNNPNEIVINLIDNAGLLKLTTEFNTKKSAIDKLSDEMRYSRDFFGHTPVIVSQFNRSIANPMRIKAGDVEPQLEDFAESSQTQNDADVVLALFDPMRYNIPDPSGYNLDKLRDEYGAKYFRSLRLIKNSYGEDDVRIGLGFLGQVGMFKELKRQKEMNDDIYESITNKSYFLRD
jgi:hypothetical protein